MYTRVTEKLLEELLLFTGHDIFVCCPGATSTTKIYSFVNFRMLLLVTTIINV
jgi:hypothetical protein